MRYSCLPARGIPESFLPSQLRLAGAFEPAPEKVFCTPLSDLISTFHPLTASGFPSVRAKSIVLWPASALGEKPWASVAMLLRRGRDEGLDLLGSLAGGQDDQIATPRRRRKDASDFPLETSIGKIRLVKPPEGGQIHFSDGTIPNAYRYRTRIRIDETGIGLLRERLRRLTSNGGTMDARVASGDRIGFVRPSLERVRAPRR